MKVFLFISFLGIGSICFASSHSNIQETQIEHSIDGNKKSRRHKRIGKRRKRKCKQFAKRKFAGA